MASTFHYRRKKTQFLVGYEDLEPIVTETI